MNTQRRSVLAGLGLGLAGGLLRPASAAAPAPKLVRLPNAMAAGGLIYDVGRAGYTADEFLLSGTAPTYPATSMADATDMSKRDNHADLGRRDFTLPPTSAPLPYVTRIVVYRPTDPARFNGRVLVEPNHPIGGGVLSVFGFMNDVFLADGNIHVSVAAPVNFPNLVASDPARYGTLLAADPTQLWGMLRDAGAALRRGGELLPERYRLAGLVMTGYSWTGVAAASFANFHHDSRTPGRWAADL